MVVGKTIPLQNMTLSLGNMTHNASVDMLRYSVNAAGPGTAQKCHGVGDFLGVQKSLEKRRGFKLSKVLCGRGWLGIAKAIVSGPAPRTEACTTSPNVFDWFEEQGCSTNGKVQYFFIERIRKFTTVCFLIFSSSPASSECRLTRRAFRT